MGFHLNWQLPTSIRQHDKRVEGDCWGAPWIYTVSFTGGSISLCFSIRLLMCLSVYLSGVLLTDDSRVNLCVKRQHRTFAGVSVCARRCLWMQGHIARRSIDLKLLLWILAFVCLIYLSRRPSFHCHSLTRGSDRSWVLHRWENNTYLWPLELFLLQKPQRKNALAAHASSNAYQGTWLLRQGKVERHFKTGIDLQLVSGVGIEQNSQGFTACTLHVLCMNCRIIDSFVSSFLFLWC